MTARKLLSVIMKFQPGVAVVTLCLCAAAAAAQTADPPPDNAHPTPTTLSPVTTDPYFDKIYRRFNETYRLGSGDEISIRIKGQPDYSVEKTKVSPAGSVYHVLLGEINVAGMTINQVTERLTNDLNEYLKNPQVSVQLVEAVSAKIGVLGEVVHPGIIVMSRPMSLLDVISEAGGFADTGSKSSVEVLRQQSNGSRTSLRVDVKKILEGKARPDDNIQMRAGDLVVVHGNKKKTLATLSTIAGFGSFVAFLARGW
ncbi:MAG: polysaccharide biosynthesis/export family protein [Blastocatellales bacterium]